MKVARKAKTSTSLDTLIQGAIQGHKRKKSGVRLLKGTPLIGVGFSGVVGSLLIAGHPFRELITQPEKAKSQLIGAGILAGASTATVAGLAALEIGQGKLEEGKNFKLIRREVWGKPTEAKFVAKQFEKMNVDERLIQKVTRWGNKQK